MYKSKVFKLINNHAMPPNPVAIKRALTVSCAFGSAKKSHSTLSQLQHASHCFSAPAHTYSSLLPEILNAIILSENSKSEKAISDTFLFS